MSETKKLTRSRNGMLGGVCAGIAEYTNADVNVIRLVTVIITILGFGSIVLVYLVAWLILPQADDPTTVHGPPPPSP